MATASPIVFGSAVLRFVCISDTHNDNCQDQIPDGDVLLHAGDLTDFGTLKELEAALAWILSLPHRVKVIVAGNHDLSLDHAHTKFRDEAVSLLTSKSARAGGIFYIDREVQTIAFYRTPDGGELPLRLYGNPMQPEFLGKPYAFIYPPAPAPEASAAWASAPGSENSVDIWVTHCPPMGRLDAINVPGLTGCAVQIEKIAQARPLLCVFGHYHYSWGMERVRWTRERSGNAEVQCLAKSKERQEAEGDNLPMRSDFDFSGSGSEAQLEVGQETIFVNAAWMTMKKAMTTYRNPPFVVTLRLPIR